MVGREGLAVSVLEAKGGWVALREEEEAAAAEALRRMEALEDKMRAEVGARVGGWMGERFVRGRGWMEGGPGWVRSGVVGWV